MINASECSTYLNMFTLFIVVVIIKQFVSQSVNLCLTAFQCANQSINMDFPRIMAYKGAYGPETYIDGIQISCDGAFACATASSILATSLFCYGGDSCSAANIKGKSTGFVFAYGVNALAHANITGSFTTLNCYGSLGCAYSVVKCNGLTTINAYGTYSLFNAIIDSQNSAATLDIYLNGYHAGYDTNITCREGRTCLIHCTFNGCINLFLDCYAQNCVVNGLSNDPIQPISYTESFCSTQPNALNFDDADELPSSTEIVLDTTNTGPMCCRGETSCRQVNINVTRAIGDTVICSGHVSCWSTEIHTNGSVFCEGQSACWFTRIYTKHHVYCNGYSSCKGSKITSTGDELIIVYLLGYYAGDDATITCGAFSTCSIVCQGYKSCSNMDLVCNGRCTVDCNEDTACPNGWTASPTSDAPISSNPTAVPSNIPSAAPISADPTAVPSNIPTAAPISANPTFKPISPNPTIIALNIPTAAISTIAPISPDLTAVPISTVNMDTPRHKTDNIDWIVVGVAIAVVVIALCLCQLYVLGRCYTKRNTKMKEQAMKQAMEIQNVDTVNQTIGNDTACTNKEDSIENTRGHDKVFEEIEGEQPIDVKYTVEGPSGSAGALAQSCATSETPKWDTMGDV
eukprot:36073_1